MTIYDTYEMWTTVILVLSCTLHCLGGLLPGHVSIVDAPIPSIHYNDGSLPLRLAEQYDELPVYRDGLAPLPIAYKSSFEPLPYPPALPYSAFLEDLPREPVETYGPPAEPLPTPEAPEPSYGPPTVPEPSQELPTIPEPSQELPTVPEPSQELPTVPEPIQELPNTPSEEYGPPSAPEAPLEIPSESYGPPAPAPSKAFSYSYSVSHTAASPPSSYGPPAPPTATPSPPLSPPSTQGPSHLPPEPSPEPRKPFSYSFSVVHPPTRSSIPSTPNLPLSPPIPYQEPKKSFKPFSYSFSVVHPAQSPKALEPSPSYGPPTLPASTQAPPLSTPTPPVSTTGPSYLPPEEPTESPIEEDQSSDGYSYEQPSNPLTYPEPEPNSLENQKELHHSETPEEQESPIFPTPTLYPPAQDELLQSQYLGFESFARPIPRGVVLPFTPLVGPFSLDPASILPHGPVFRSGPFFPLPEELSQGIIFKKKRSSGPVKK